MTYKWFQQWENISTVVTNKKGYAPIMNIPAFVSAGYSGQTFFKNCVAF